MNQKKSKANLCTVYVSVCLSLGGGGSLPALQRVEVGVARWEGPPGRHGAQVTAAALPRRRRPGHQLEEQHRAGQRLAGQDLHTARHTARAPPGSQVRLQLLEVFDEREYSDL